MHATKKNADKKEREAILRQLEEDKQEKLRRREQADMARQEEESRAVCSKILV